MVLDNEKDNKMESKANQDDQHETPEYWEKMISSISKDGDITTASIIEDHYKFFGKSDGPLTKTTTRGAKEWMQNEIKKLNMKHSQATSNASRYKWLCHHFVDVEKKNADPSNYKSLPMAFAFHIRFYKHHFQTTFRFLMNPNVQFLLAMYLLLCIHSWSYQLYASEIPLLYIPYSCVKMPFQYHCEFLSFLQRNSFDGIMDMKKTFMVVATRMVLSMISNLVLTRKHIGS